MMPAYSFKKEFRTPIEKQLKEHTLRGKRKRPTVPGDMLSLYTGMRTKFCQLIMKVRCTFVYDAKVTSKGVWIGGKKVNNNNQFARSDGFKDFDDMILFWKKNNQLPWKGELISWSFKDPKKVFTDKRETLYKFD